MSSKSHIFSSAGLQEKVSSPSLSSFSLPSSVHISKGLQSSLPSTNGAGTGVTVNCASKVKNRMRNTSSLSDPVPCASCSSMKAWPSKVHDSYLPPISVTSASRSARSSEHSAFRKGENAITSIIVTAAADSSVPCKGSRKTVTPGTVSSDVVQLCRASYVELQGLQGVQEWKEEIEALLRRERAHRSMILGLEHESRYRYMWDYHAESEKNRTKRRAKSKVATAWREKKYLDSIKAYHQWSTIWTEEVNDRDELLHAEEESWEYLCGCWELECLQVDAAEIDKDCVQNERRWEAHVLVREEEMKAGEKKLQNQIFRGRKIPNSIPLLSNGSSPLSTAAAVCSLLQYATGREIGEGLNALSYTKRRLRFVSSPEVVEMEFQSRQKVRREEIVARTSWMAEGEKHFITALEEQKIRQDLYQLFYAGWSSFHLSCMIRIQRWWRQIRAHPWSYYRRSHYRSLLAAHRSLQTSSDYKLRIARLEKPSRRLLERYQIDSSSCGYPISTEVLKVEELLKVYDQERLLMLSAAVFRYKFMMDLYVFSLQQLYNLFIEDQRRYLMVQIDLCLQRYPDVEDRQLLVAVESNEEWMSRRRLEKHLAVLLKAPHTMPKRLFTRYRLPYPSWRATRWMEWSEFTLQSVRLLCTEEKQCRKTMMNSYIRNVRGLHVFHHALLQGLQRVREYERSMLMLYQDERERRQLVGQEEKEGRVEMKLYQLRLHDWWAVRMQMTLSLLEESDCKRKELLVREELEYASLIEKTWRWDHLGAARLRVSYSRYPYGESGWDAEVHGKSAQHFVSLQSVAEVIARFYYRTRHMYKKRIRNVANGATVSDTTRSILICTACSIAEKLKEDCYHESAAQTRERQKKLDLNQRSKGSNSFLDSTRSSPPGFSYLALEDATSLSCEGQQNSPCSVQEIENMRNIESKNSTYQTRAKIGEQNGDTDEAGLVISSASLNQQQLSVRQFRLWLEIAANIPREKQYKAVLNRFHHQNKDFYHVFSILLSLMRKGREDIEEKERSECYRFRNHLCYRKFMSLQISCEEQKQRKLLADEESVTKKEIIEENFYFTDTVLLWRQKMENLIDTTASPLRLSWQLMLEKRGRWHRCRSNAPSTSNVFHHFDESRSQCAPFPHSENILHYVHNGPSLESILKGQLFSDSPRTLSKQGRIRENKGKENEVHINHVDTQRLPSLSDFDRVLSREEVTRIRIETERNRELTKSLLFSFSFPFRTAIEVEAKQTLESCCRSLDKKFPADPPIALSSFIIGEEAIARNQLEKDVPLKYYEESLLFAHRQYLEDCVLMQFTLGHASLSSAATHMEKSLSDLLVQRAHHIDRKKNDLVELEQASRSRVEYMNDITRQLRWRWNKLLYVHK